MQVVELADELAMGRPTNWGHPFNVRTEGDVQEGRSEPMLDLAYSKQVLGFHTDNPCVYQTSSDPHPQLNTH